MKKVNQTAQMKAMDAAAMTGIYRMPPAVLMENAGHAVVTAGAAYLDGWANKDVIIFCGQGNNGGDGFVIARHLLAADARVYVYVLGQAAAYSPEAQCHLHSLRQLDGADCIVVDYGESFEAWHLLCHRLFASQVVIDAMIGTGFHGELRQPVRNIVGKINEAAAMGRIKVIAVDMPSGVDADTGAVSVTDGADGAGGPLFADLTVTFGALKRGQLFYPGKTSVGELRFDPIGMPAPLLRQQETDGAYVLESADVAELLPPRQPDSHKGTHGTIAVVAGSNDMAGAALMTAQGAMRAGAGKIFLQVPAATAPYCIGRVPEVMVRGVGAGSSFAPGDADVLVVAAHGWSALAMGPGMGKDSGLTSFLKKLIEETSCPIVLDADALNALTEERGFIAAHGERIIMTPHLAEFGRLSGLSVATIKEDCIRAAKNFVKRWNVTLVLKGAPTIIVSRKTGNAYLNPTGNAGMACGGMGDVLTGMVAALAAHRDLGLTEAACAAVYLHGAAGDVCRQAYGPYGYSPLEVAAAIPRVLAELDEGRRLPVLRRPLIEG